MIALVQCVSLAAMLFGRHPDNGVMAGLTLVLLLAPLLPIQGLGQIPAPRLLTWTAGAAVFLFGTGFYLHWRAADNAVSQSSFATIAMVGAFLFIGQSLLLAHGGRVRASYRALYQASWSIFIQLLFCGLCAVALWALWRSFPAISPAALVIMPIAASLIMAFVNGTALRRIEPGLTYVLTSCLPAAILVSVLEILFWSLTQRLPPLVLSSGIGVLTVTAINASYRDGGWRPEWRRRLEFAGAVLLLPLVVLAALALQARVAQFGFTANRVLALALVLLLSAYALAYAGAALISLGGGRAMERLETGNLAIAFMAMSMLAMMVTPVADPVRLAVMEQSWRLTHGAVAPAKFDYGWLRKSGLRFGHEALVRLGRP
ncbi:MAG TPA: DUF4153 domain-containing protein [Rhizomicrobium sp.]